jgi:hypothetical protein
MRIPTSVFVMSIVTAVPFGLAIRDTLKHKTEDPDTRYLVGGAGALRETGDDREQREEYLREAEREETERAEQRQQKLAKLDELYGKSVASMGSLFTGVVLGSDGATFRPESAHGLQDAERDGFLSVDYMIDSRVLHGVTVTLAGSDYDPATGEVVDRCAILREKLVAAWGPSTGGIWLAPTTHERARLDSRGCTLGFDRYLDVADWMAAVSPNLIGTKAAAALDANGGRLDQTGSDLTASWTLAGVGAGDSATEVEIVIAKGKIAGLQVITTTDFDTAVQIRERLGELLKGKPTEDPDLEMWTWKRRGKPTVELVYTTNGALTLSTGW